MRRQIERTLMIILGIGVTVIPIHSQTKPQKPSFEIISVKPSPPGPGFTVTLPQGDRLAMSGATLKTLMAVAYRDSTTDYELDVFGGPDWMVSARYEVQAKADCSGGIISLDQQSLMVQSLLEDRFQLKAHLEMRELPVYNLVVGKDGSKLKPSADQTPAPQVIPGSQLCGPTPVKMPTATMPAFPAPGTDPSKFLSQLPRGGIYTMPSPEGPMLQGAGVAIGRFVAVLKLLTGRQVIDKTGLAGLFDIKLKFSTDGLAVLQPPPGAVRETPATADPAPNLFTAIQDLGLKLEQARAPVQVVVIDSVRKPSEN